MRKTLIAVLAAGSLTLMGAGSVAVHAASANPTDTRPFHHMSGNKHFRSDNAALAKLLGITSDQLISEMKSGKKIEDIAVAHGITSDQLKKFMETQHQAMIDTMKTKLATEVAAGKITQAQMNEKIQRMTTHPIKMHERKIPTELAKLFNMSAEEIQTAMKSGKTLQQIATEHNVTTDQLNQYFTTERQAMIDKMKTKLSAEVQSGKITQSKMDQMMQKVSAAPAGQPDMPFMGGFKKGGRHEFKNKTNNTAATPSAIQVQ